MKRGFTLVELVVVMAIIAVLALLIAAAIVGARKTTTETINKGNARTIMIGLENLRAKKGKYCDPGLNTQCKVGVWEINCPDLADQLRADGAFTDSLAPTTTSYMGVPNVSCVVGPLTATGYALRVYDYSGTRLIQYFDMR